MSSIITGVGRHPIGQPWCQVLFVVLHGHVCQGMGIGISVRSTLVFVLVSHPRRRAIIIPICHHNSKRLLARTPVCITCIRGLTKPTSLPIILVVVPTYSQQRIS